MSAIKLTPIKSRLDTNLESIESNLELMDNNIRAAIQNLNQSYDKFWNLPDEEILEILNHLGISKSMEMFETHYKHAVALNSIMEDRGIIGDRAVHVKPRDITVDENGLFIFVPVVLEVVEEPVVEPMVDPIIDEELAVDPVIEEPI